MKMDTDAIVHRDTQEADVTKVSFQIWHIMTHYIMTYVIALKVSYWQAFNNFYFYLNKFLEETARVTWTFKYLYFENIFFSFYFFPEISPCFPNPCQNGGHCIRSGYSYTCNCVAGFTSDNCEDGMWYIERIKHSGRKGEREDLIILRCKILHTGMSIFLEGVILKWKWLLYAYFICQI